MIYSTIYKCTFIIFVCFAHAQNNTTNYYARFNKSNTIYKHQTYDLARQDLRNEKLMNVTNLELGNYAKHLEQSSVIFGLTIVANNSNVSGQCHKQLKTIQRGIMRKEPWAMKVLDASGTKPSGFMFGQNFWFGSRETCGAVQEPVGITLSKDFERVMHDGIITQVAPFDMNYRVIYLRHNSPWQVEIKLMSEQIIHIGLCLPSNCASSEIQKLTSEYVNSGHFVENDIYDIQPEVVYMKDLQLQSSFYEKKTFKMIGAFTLFTAGMILLAGLLRLPSTVETEKHQQQQQILNNQIDKTEKETLGIFMHIKNFAKCYDLTANSEKLFRLNNNNCCSDIPVLNGLRSVCAFWIMIFHVVWFMYFTVNNKTFLISYAEQIFFQYVSSAPLLVDVFFTISGFLQIYNFLNKTKQMQIIRENNFKQNLKLFYKMLFHRYLRLAPLYLVVMGVVDLFYAYMDAVSVYHINERFDEICSKYWWRNLLFIQNFFNHQDMCLNWTWSLACEMQFFVLATILLFFYVKHPKYVKSAVAAALVSTIVWTYRIGLHSKFLLSFDSAFATGTDIYINPFVRVLPYILGALSAWYFVECQCQLHLSELKERCEFTDTDIN